MGLTYSHEADGSAWRNPRKRPTISRIWCKTKNVVEFGLTSKDLSDQGGAATYEKGEVGNQNVRVLLNPGQANVANRILHPDTSLVLGDLGVRIKILAVPLRDASVALVGMVCQPVVCPYLPLCRGNRRLTWESLVSSK